MVRRQTLQWMGHVLRMDEDRLPQQVFDCSLARSVAEDGRMEQLNSAIRDCHEEGSDSGTTFRAFSSCLATLNLSLGREISAAVAERALDRQAWRDAIKSLARLEFKKPQQVGRMSRLTARRGGSG
eukprot:360571-Chlamydomonas_euryale.AAC.2